MATANPDSRPRSRSPFRGFDQAVERALGADMRLLYGFAVPILMVIGLIILLGLGPSTWVVVLVLIFEVAALGVVVTGLMGMLNDDGDNQES